MSAFEFDLQRFASNGKDLYANLTDDEKENIRTCSLPHIRMISIILNSPLIKPLLDADNAGVDFLSKYVSPVLKFVGSVAKKGKFPKSGDLNNELKIVASAVKIADTALDIIDGVADSNGTKTFADYGEDVTKIVSEIVSIVDANKNLNGNGSVLMSFASVTLAYVANLVSTFDGITDKECAALGKAASKLIGSGVTSIIKTVAKDSSLVDPFGPIDAAVSIGLAIVEGITQAQQREEYYRDDGLPEDIALKESRIDAILFGLHEGVSNYTKGINNVVFDATKLLSNVFALLGSKITGDEFEFTWSEMNYVECIREIAKHGEYNSSSSADTLMVTVANSSLYAQDGDDQIYNSFPYVTILAGHGNDTVSASKGSKYNSILGGAGNDMVFFYDLFSTIYGNKDEDNLRIYGTKNKIFGDDGNDVLFIEADSNTVSGGAGNDIIEFFGGAKKAVIEYTQGDGTDVIYGYDASDLIKIKGNYSTVISGNDVLIYVGDGGIIVKDAKDLKININTIELAEDETLPTSGKIFFTNPYDNAIVLMDGLWSDQKALRGTNGNDYIENTLSNVMIYGFDGSDTIINRGDNVTINSGAGADKIYNYGATVKINAGDDNDYIYSEGREATLVGADGSDTIQNSGENSYIDGGAGNDSIVNSGDNSRINGADGNDTIKNSGYNSRINGGNGMNYIENTDSYVTIEGSDDEADVIYSNGDNVSINAYEGNNSISIDGTAGGEQTVTAGDGDNTLQVGERDETEEKRYYNYIDVGDGNNYINNSNVELSTIWSGDGNDTIITGGGEAVAYSSYYGRYPYANVDAGAGDNRITVNSYMKYGEIYAGAGNDFVSIVSDGSGSKNIVSLGNGNDSVIADVDDSTINVGAGDNFVSLHSTGDSIIAGSGDDYVILAYNGGGNNASLGSGNNTLISNGRENVTAGAGDDNITVKGGHLELGDGKNNVLLTYGGNTDIFTGKDNDTINVKARDETDEQRYYNKIYAGDGNNYIDNSNVERSTIISGSGNDTIITGGGINGRWRGDEPSTSIVAGAGDNRITVNSSMTYGEIYAGAGNDLVSISSGGGNNIVSLNSGNDTVIADVDNSTINVGAGKNFVSLSNGGNSIIAGNGNNTLISTNGRESVTMGDGDNNVTIVDGYISVGSGNNKLSMTANEQISIFAGSGSDTINIADSDKQRYYNKIYAGDGNNYINNSNVERSSITAGSGNDTIITGGGEPGGYSYGYFNYTSIVAGAGNNRITVNSSMRYGEIYAGAGNDLVSIGGEGSDNIISVGNGRNSIITSTYYDPAYNQSNTITAGTGSDAIRTSGKYNYINAGSGRNSITLTGGERNSIVTGKGNDTIRLSSNTNNNVIIFGGGKDVVYNYHSGDTVKAIAALSVSTVGNDIVLTDGTSRMTLKSASGKTINTQELSSSDSVYKILVADKTVGDTLMPSGLPDKTPTEPVGPTALKADNALNSISFVGTILDDTITNSGKKVTIVGNAGDDSIGNKGANVSINGGKGDDTVTNSGAKVTILGGAGDDYISNTGATVNVNGGKGDDTVTNSGTKVTILGGAGDDSIGNKGANVNVNGGTGDDIVTNSGAKVTIVGGTGDDSIINMGANVLINGGKGDDSITSSGDGVTLSGGAGDDMFIYGAGKAFISDYAEGHDTIKIASGTISNTSLNGSDVVFTIGKNSLTVKNGKGKSIALIDSAGKNSTQTVSDILTVTNSTKSPVTVAPYVKTIDASARTSAVRITGNDLANTIMSGSGNATLTGGKGNDVFIYSGGKDVISDYTAGDKISLGAAITDTAVSGSNVVFSVGSGSLTINNAKGKALALIDSKGKSSTATVSDVLTVTNSTKSPVTVPAYVKTVNASKRTSAVKITGNASANSIVGGSGADSLYGGAGNDTLRGGKGNDSIVGGKGNDSLWGDKGNDTFIYSSGDGTDVIHGFDSGDLLKITGAFSASYSKSTKSVAFKVGSGSVTLRDFGSTTTFHVNNDTYQLSGGKLNKK